MIDSGVAPMALRMPISRVRSATVIIMMLLTPMAPANMVRTPTTQVRPEMPRKRLLIFLNSFCRLKLPKACLSSGWMRWRAFSASSTSCSISAEEPLLPTRMAMVPRRLAVLKVRAKVVRGMKMRPFTQSPRPPVMGDLYTPATT
jgi:hypothetical protein